MTELGLASGREPGFFWLSRSRTEIFRDVILQSRSRTEYRYPEKLISRNQSVGTVGKRASRNQSSQFLSPFLIFFLSPSTSSFSFLFSPSLLSAPSFYSLYTAAIIPPPANPFQNTTDHNATITKSITTASIKAFPVPPCPAKPASISSSSFSTINLKFPMRLDRKLERERECRVREREAKRRGVVWEKKPRRKNKRKID